MTIQAAPALIAQIKAASQSVIANGNQERRAGQALLEQFLAARGSEWAAMTGLFQPCRGILPLWRYGAGLCFRLLSPQGRRGFSGNILPDSGSSPGRSSPTLLMPYRKPPDAVIRSPVSHRVLSQAVHGDSSEYRPVVPNCPRGVIGHQLVASGTDCP